MHPPKTFYLMHNVGKAKYLVNFVGGIRKNLDGTPQVDVRIFKNKIKLNAFIQSLTAQGYRQV